MNMECCVAAGDLSDGRPACKYPELGFYFDEHKVRTP